MGAALPGFAQALGDGIVAIDTGFHRPGFDAAYLIVDDGRAAFFDTGTNFALPRLLATLDALGLPRSAVDWVIPSHVHLDHAGGAGALMRELPAARLLVHPRGLKHLVDPGALYDGALAVYGAEAMARDYGRLVPVDAARAAATEDGQTIRLGQRTLEFAHTPGHARHHHCLWDARSRSWFTGDTFGLSYREFDTARGAWMMVSSTPVQFDPPALAASVRRLLAQQPRWVQLTHFGRIGDLERTGPALLAAIDAMAEIGRSTAGGDGRHERLRDALRAWYLRGARAHGCTLPEAAVVDLLTLDIELNAQGIGIWRDRVERAAR
ncbi:MAG: MBL fold metallo-hydrolase [Burkholderiales bacterium]|nr:MBL fold metallo-hydrolase [Burkholderiales bacterium]